MSPSDSPGRASEITRVACLGGGVIGRSWVALFLAAGKSVVLFDPDPEAEHRVREAVEAAWPALTAIGLANGERRGELDVVKDPGSAVAGAEFIQESVPERLDVKHALFAEMEPSLAPHAIVASSASGLTLSELQAGFRDPGRLVLGHPFNPPHLIPLVEVMGNASTQAGVVASARAFYESVGKETIELRGEVPGHVANRLQAALWREALNLVIKGVATVEDVDRAVSAGPGIRWAVMGPTMLFHLGAGEGGLGAFFDRYAGSFDRWWDDLGQPHLDHPTIEKVLAAMPSDLGLADVAELSARRDALLTAVIAAKREAQAKGSRTVAIE